MIIPFSEPWRTTALRTGSLALVAGAIAGLYTRQLAVVPIATLLALWFTLGGHFFEVLFLDRLRPHFGGGVVIQLLARLVYWFAAGAMLFEGALATRALLVGRMTLPLSWWMAGAGFVGIELVVHLGSHVRGLPSFYDGRG